MQHVFSLGSVFRASPFVNYHHTPPMDSAPDAPPISTLPEAKKDPSPPPPPPPQQKLLIKLRVSDLSKQRNAEPETDVDELVDDDDVGLPAPAPAPVKRRGGGAGTRGKRRKVEPGTPTSDGDASVSVSWDSASGTATPAKRGRGGKGSRGGGRGRGGRKSGLQHQVLPAELSVPGTPDSMGELSLRPGSPSSASTSLAPTPTPISTPTLTIPPATLTLPPSSLSTPSVLTPIPPTPAPAEIDPALLATAPRRPLPTRAFPVQPAPKTTAAVVAGAGSSADWSRRKVRKWGVAWREVKGVGGGSWWVRTWVGSNESEYASDPARILAVPSTLPRPTKPRKTDSSTAIPRVASSFIDVKPIIPPPPVLLDGKPLAIPHVHEPPKSSSKSHPADVVPPPARALSASGHYRDEPSSSHYRDTQDTEDAKLLAAFASSSAQRVARKIEPAEGWSASVSVTSSGGGIGGKHYRDEERGRYEREGEGERGYYRDRTRERDYEYGSGSGSGGKKYYRDTSSKAEGSSAGSTPGPGVPVIREKEVVVVEEVVSGGDGWKGKGKAVDLVNGKAEVNGSVKGKGKGKEEVVNGSGPPAGGPAVVLAGEGRVRSGSGYEQAARDVEMELMGEL